MAEYFGSTPANQIATTSVPVVRTGHFHFSSGFQCRSSHMDEDEDEDDVVHLTGEREALFLLTFHPAKWKTALSSSLSPPVIETVSRRRLRIV